MRSPLVEAYRKFQCCTKIICFEREAATYIMKLSYGPL
jgi:hypothetical protein